MSVISIIDFVSLLASLIAFIILLRGWKRALPRNAKLFLAGFFTLSLFHSFSNILEWSGITAVLDHFEDYLQILEPILLGGFFFTFLQNLTEEALRESKEKLAGIIESVTDAMIMVDKQFNVIWINGVAKGLLGRESNPIGEKCYKAFHGHDKVCEPCIIKQSFKDGQVHEFEKELPGVDGNRMSFWCTSSIAAWHEDGRPKMGVEFLRDMTERKQALREVKELKQNMEFILGATKTGIDIIDSEFNIRYIDPEWEKIYGDPTGRKCYKYFMDRTEVCPGCGILKALETKKTTVTEEVLPKEGNRPIQVITMPFQNSQGEWLVAEVNVDITERKRTEEELQEKIRDLERFQKLTVGREIKMIELKEKIKKLEQKLKKKK